MKVAGSAKQGARGNGWCRLQQAGMDTNRGRYIIVFIKKESVTRGVHGSMQLVYYTTTAQTRVMSKIPTAPPWESPPAPWLLLHGQPALAAR